MYTIEENAFSLSTKTWRKRKQCQRKHSNDFWLVWDLWKLNPFFSFSACFAFCVFAEQMRVVVIVVRLIRIICICWCCWFSALFPCTSFQKITLDLSLLQQVDWSEWDENAYWRIQRRWLISQLLLANKRNNRFGEYIEKWRDESFV